MVGGAVGGGGSVDVWIVVMVGVVDGAVFGDAVAGGAVVFCAMVCAVVDTGLVGGWIVVVLSVSSG